MGELLTENCMAMVGSSMTISGSGCGFSRLVMVSPMVMPVDAGDGDDVADLGLCRCRCASGR